jgi:TolA-binding protein
MFHRSSYTIFIVALFLFFSLGITGCGSTEPTIEDEAVTDTGVDSSQPADTTTTATEPPPEQTQEQQPQQQEEQPKQEEVQQEQPQEGVDVSQLQQENDALKSENEMLKKNMDATERENMALSKKISDLEAAAAAARSRQKEEKVQRPVEARPSMPGRSSTAEVKAYEGAVSMVKKRKLPDAMAELQSLLNSGIKDDYADNCHYWLGECNFQSKNYRAAIDHFKAVQSYKFSEKKDDAQLMIAQCYERLGEKDKATAEYKKLVDSYPTSEYVTRARARIK